jgi:hypothetical protein
LQRYRYDYALVVFVDLLCASSDKSDAATLLPASSVPASAATSVLAALVYSADTVQASVQHHSASLTGSVSRGSLMLPLSEAGEVLSESHPLVTVQTAIDLEAGSGVFQVLDELSAKCLTCSKYYERDYVVNGGGEYRGLLHGSSSSRISLHVNSDKHKVAFKNLRIITAQRSMFSSFRSDTATAAVVPSKPIVLLHCKGFTDTEYTFKSDGFAWTCNPMKLVHDQDTVRNVEQGWRPHPTGSGKVWFPHLRSTRCIAERRLDDVPADEYVPMEQLIDGRSITTLFYVCSRCRSIPVINSVYLRLLRDRIFFETSGVARGARSLQACGGVPNNIEARNLLPQLSALLSDAKRAFRRNAQKKISKAALLDILNQQTEKGNVQVRSPHVVIATVCSLSHSSNACELILVCRLCCH